jgi:hypothetical protein
MNFPEGRPAAHFDTFPIALLTVFQVKYFDIFPIALLTVFQVKYFDIFPIDLLSVLSGAMDCVLVSRCDRSRVLDPLRSKRKR